MRNKKLWTINQEEGAHIYYFAHNDDLGTVLLWLILSPLFLMPISCQLLWSLLRYLAGEQGGTGWGILGLYLLLFLVSVFGMHSRLVIDPWGGGYSQTWLGLAYRTTYFSLKVSLYKDFDDDFTTLFEEPTGIRIGQREQEPFIHLNVYDEALLMQLDESLSYFRTIADDVIGSESES